MVKAKTSPQPKNSIKGTRMKLKPNSGLIEFSPTEELLDEEFIARAVWDCLKSNDTEALVEIIEAHLRAKNKSALAKKNNLSRTTLHHAFKGKNPTIKTLAKMINCCD